MRTRLLGSWSEFSEQWQRGHRIVAFVNIAGGANLWFVLEEPIDEPVETAQNWMILVEKPFY